jgi:MFS family permease
VTAVPVRGRRDLALLMAGQGVSAAGDMAALTALTLRVQGAGAGWIAALLLAELIPIVVLAPVVGRIVDRFETRRVLLIGLAGQAVIAIPLALVQVPVATIALFLLLNALNALVRPAASALVPAIVGPDRAPHGYAQIATAGGVGRIAGPAVGGLLSGLAGTSTALLVDAASFAALAVAVLALRIRRVPEVADATTERTGGYALIWRSRILRIAIGGTCFVLVCAVIDNVAVPYRYVDQLHGGALGFGIGETAWSIGSVLGSQLIRRIPPERQALALALGNLGTGLGIAGIGFAPTYAIALGAAVFGGIGNGLENVAVTTLVAAQTPTAAHGRAFSAVSGTLQTAIGIGTFVAAPVIVLLGPAGALIVAGCAASVVAVATIAVRPSGAADAPAVAR